MIFQKYILLIIAIWPITAKSAVLELLPEAQVDLQGIFLKHLIKPTKDASGEIQLAPAPAWGETRILNRSQVATLITQAVPTAQFLLEGAPEIRITRKSQKLEQKELLELLTKELQPPANSDAELQLQLARDWKPVMVPVDHYELKVTDRPSSGLSPTMIVRFQVVSDDELVGNFLVSLRAQLYRDVWVARTAVRRMATMAEADLVRERRDVINVRQAVWEGAALDPSLQIAEYVPPGGVLYARAVRQRPVVRRGDVVQGVVSDGPLSVSVRVEALEDGAPDDIIRARNPRTKKEVRGKVINEEVIVLTF